MRELLARPYMPPRSGRGAWLLAALFGLFVFLFLFLFTPFSLAQAPGSLLVLALGYGLACFGVMVLLNVAVPALVPGFFRREVWTVGRQLAWVMVNLAVIGGANVLYSAWMGVMRLSPGGLLWFEGYTFLTGLLPVGMLVLWNEARSSRRFREGSAQINGAAAAKQAKNAMATAGPAVSAPITIPSENGKEDLLLPMADLLYIRSSGNYLEVFHGAEGQVVRKVLRGSLKRVEEALAGVPRVKRCHKSHIVNLARVSRVSGNAQGYQLHFTGTGDTVPVSRTLNASLSALLAEHP